MSSMVNQMQNFINTEWKHLSEEEFFELHQGLVFSTIKKQFPNYRSYCRVHMIEFDDLVQQGSFGLLTAIRTFDPNTKNSFRSHAINHISWGIKTHTKKDSLRNTSSQTFDLVNMVSGEELVSQEDDSVTIIDSLVSDSNTSEEVEDKNLEQTVVRLLEQDKDVNEELLYILVARMQGKTMEEIGEHLGIHRNAVSQRLLTQKVTRIKERLTDSLRNGD